MKVLVTGINGFVGRAIGRKLIEDNTFELTGTGLKDKCSWSQEIRYISADISKEDFIETLIKTEDKYEIIIHVAASIDQKPFSREVIFANCLGMQQVIALSTKIGCKKIIYISSVPVIGIPKELPIKESHPVMPQTTYHATKLFGENLLMMSKQFGIQPIILRITSPIGSEMPKGRMLPVFIKSLIENEPISVYGTGKRRQNYVDVRDIAQAVIKACKKPGAEGVFNIGGSTSYSNRELAEICKRIISSSSSIMTKENQSEEQEYNWEVSIEKAKTVFDYNPEYTMEDTVLDMIKISI